MKVYSDKIKDIIQWKDAEKLNKTNEKISSNASYSMRESSITHQGRQNAYIKSKIDHE